MAAPDDIPADVKAAYDGHNAAMRAKLIDLRALIFDVAASDPRIGDLHETLKWGEPSYLTHKTKSGTTVRINAHRKSPREYAFYVNCRTDLVERYREIYGDILSFDGNRAVVFDIEDSLPEEPVRHCLAMALRYHLE